MRCNDLIARVVGLFPETFVGVVHAAAKPEGGHDQLDRRAGTLRDRAGLHRLQPQSRSGRRPLHPSAADRPLLVSLLREDGGAGRAGDDPRLGQLQPGDARHRRLLHRGRHDRLHAAAGRQSVHRFPDPALHHPAWRRRGALSLGPLSRAGGHAQAAEPRPASDEQRVLRYLRLSPAGHRPAGRRDREQEHPVRQRDGGRGARHRSHDRPSISTTPSAMSMRWISPTRNAPRFSKAMPGACSRGSTPS